MKRAGSRPLLHAILLVPCLLLVGCAEPGPLARSDSQSRRPTELPAASAGAYVAMGTAYLATEQPELAYEAFLTSIRIDGISAEALVGAGIALKEQGLLTAARRHFETALELDPESLIAQNNLGVVLFLLKEYYPARDAFRAAYALSSGRSGIAERNLNRAEAVVALIEEAEQSDPAISHRVVRLGTSEFRITPSPVLQAEMMGAE